MARLGLSFLQVFGASLGVGLLLQAGATWLTLLVVVLTGLCTVASLVLPGGRLARRQSAPHGGERPR
jgi:hypothetical protein